MSEFVDPKEVVPDTNLDSVLSKLLLKTKDFTGDGLVEVFRTLLARAEEIQRAYKSANVFGEELIGQKITPDDEEVKAELQSGWYETTCLKWFLARACERLAGDLGFSVYQSQNHMRRIVQICYADDGQVESYSLDSGTDHAVGQ
jgi:hypothetical protein